MRIKVFAATVIPTHDLARRDHQHQLRPKRTRVRKATRNSYANIDSDALTVHRGQSSARTHGQWRQHNPADQHGRWINRRELRQRVAAS